MATLRYNDYVAAVDYDPGTKLFHGRVVNVNSVISFYGATGEELEREFATSMETYFEVCRENGISPDKPYSGRVNIRLTPELHRDLVAAAQSQGKSLNAWAAEVLKQAVLH
ncbi:type II toxin-antitoxin system HicB family antitoxin [Desulfovibrio sulfodismutans]|uniref:Type II toxin-antitoxin system HicB family antitoxin n=1 Tax=Desulfolutivibrio sulfodismutans TaxID=63561 RepID=A0A7K3NKV2_9BACT|nr:type II toxin-antitoxin system HicB family antitoxin [Desulfolutivibrio sulfodismutans]NDY56395.1 type II toxin-antitoxin system HicB family antitoxin [Desulfolutivibrio sulfodismutans]QLA13435.1 toxin-antitoxin system HicB family antitoxin [Desulfolutivibrio sulfodismutans DSM 3696]